jgi:hypothetical protein
MTSTDTRTDAHHYAETIADELVGVAHGELDGYEPDDRVDALMTWLNDLALDVDVTRNLATGDVTAVEVARTIGGPGCYVRFASDGVTVRAYWGTDEARVTLPYVDGHDLAELMLDLMAEASS